MRFLTKFSLNNPVAVVFCVLLIIIGGFLSAINLNEELMPDIALPVLAVITPYPGASPSEVAEQVSKPLEEALRGVSNVKTVTSTSVANASEVELELPMNANLNDVQQKVQQAVQNVSLPTNALKPVIQKFSFNSQPVVNVTVAAGHATYDELQHVVQTTIVPAIQGLPGVATIQTGGLASKFVSIQVQSDRLAEHRLTTDDVVQTLQANNLTVPLGTEVLNSREQPVELNAKFQSLDDIRNLEIPVPPAASAGLNQIQSGMSSLGESVHKVASSVSEVGQSVGLVHTENLLLTKLVSIQGQRYGIAMSLAAERAKPSMARDAGKVAELTATDKALSASQQQLQGQLNQLQVRLSKAPGPQTNPGPASVHAFLQAGDGASAMDETAVKGVRASPDSQTTLTTVALGDVADVSLQSPDDSSINRTNGQQSVFLGIVKTEDANTVSMANAVNQKLSDLARQLPDGIHIVPLFDASQMVKSSIDGMVREALLGAGFAVLVILIFLRNWRTTAIAVVSIPLSLLMALVALNALHITLNIMTLGGMAVATGRVVDDSIVVIENTYRTWLQSGESGKGLVLRATHEVGSAITASTVTTVAVFVPLAFVSGIVGKMFTPFAVTVVTSLLSSLLVALTVVPLLGYLFVVRKLVFPTGQRPSEAHPPKWHSRYRRVLDQCLNHKGLVIAITCAAFIGSLCLLPLAGSTFIPASREKYVTVQIDMPSGTPKDVTNQKAATVESILRQADNTVVQWNTQIGTDAGQTGGSGAIQGQNVAQMFIELQPNTDVDQFVGNLRSRLQPVQSPGSIQVKELILGGASGSFDVDITGTNQQHLSAAAQSITKSLKDLPGLANVQNNLSETQPKVTVVPKPKEASRTGLSGYQIATLVRRFIEGDKAGSVSLHGQTYDINVHEAQPEGAPTVASLSNMKLSTPTGGLVPLSTVADVKQVQSAVRELHRDGQPYAAVSGSFTTQNTGKTTKAALARIQALHLPDDVHVELSGDAQQQNQSFRDLIEATVVAALLVYIIMVLVFGGWKAPFAILFSMPVALIGAFVGTVIGRQPISVSSLIGILMLVGIVVTNAIVLVDRVEQQRRRGALIRNALLEAGTTRLRPILMTAIATIFALMPLAMGFAEGALISQGLAVVVIGGLITSTVLTLIIVPVVYELLHRRMALPVVENP